MSKEIIERIERQLNHGYIDLNDDYDNEEMNYIRKAIYDLELYKKAFEIMTDNKHTFFVCKGRGPASNEMVRDAILEQARKELENDK